MRVHPTVVDSFLEELWEFYDESQPLLAMVARFVKSIGRYMLSYVEERDASFSAIHFRPLHRVDIR